MIRYEVEAPDASSHRDSNAVIENLLDERVVSAEAAFDADVISYIGPIWQPAVLEIKDLVEGIPSRRDRLVVLLETTGGYIQAAERIARIFRHHYKTVDFLVPNFAMSAGTILVMSGDGIYMDYSAVLGPIDPQVEIEDHLVPALGYLHEYNRLILKSKRGTLTTAELMYLVQNFDAAQLYRYKQERELSIALLKEWLVNFKFKNWKKTQTRKKTVTKAMREKRATSIAKMLIDTNRWHSHSRGIPIEVLRKDLNLLINDFGEDDSLRIAVHDYYRLLKDYNMRRDHNLMILHRKGNYVGF